ncbi:MAG: FimB/Mfa2 family fimbrial subunit [Bacteroides sp.]|nr:FimB/Mfa2 family fimbrial subunit [Bacteroides sp.]
MAMLLGWTACSQDENLPTQPEEVKMTIIAQLPLQAVTRADAPLANSLTVGIYEKKDNTYTLLKREAQEITANSFDYVATLVKGTEYRIVFWADNQPDTESGAAPYALSDLQSVEMQADAANYEAFTAYVDVTGGKSAEPITLTRPVAQVNIAATAEDYKAAVGLKHTPTAAKLTLNNSFKTFNALTGEVSGSGTVGFTDSITAPAEGVADATAVPFVTGYTFAKTEETKLTCKLEVADASEIFFTGEYKDIPVQANYRTNISGRLMTGSVTCSVTLEAKTTDSKNQTIE